MNELAGTRPESISRLQWFALVTIAGAIFLNTAPYIGLLTNTPNFDKHSTIAKAPPTPAAHVVARAEVQTTKPESVTGSRGFNRVTPRQRSKKRLQPSRRPRQRTRNL
jgi:hypothetical protein